MFVEDDLLALSALAQLVFCERRCALIHIEQLWEDNRFTVAGAHLHNRVHEIAPRREVRGDLMICRGVALRSFRLGVSGVADVVEFHRSAPSAQSAGAKGEEPLVLEWLGSRGWGTPFPVEYKVGQMRHEPSYEVQLCAQAICLEEMLGTVVPAGALFYGKTRRRHEVTFTSELRAHTEHAATRLHELIASGRTPPAVKQKKCDACSLLPRCLPASAPGRSAAEVTRRQLARLLAAGGSREGP